MKLSNIKQFIASYPERIIFGVCAIIFLVVLIGYFTGGKDNETVSSAIRESDELKKVITLNELAALGKVECLKKIKGNWEEIQQPTEGKAWLMYRPPVITVEFTRESTFIIEKKANLPPAAKSVITDTNRPDEITLTWDGNMSSTAQIKGYRIYRRAQGEKDFAAIAEIPAVTSTESSYTHVDKGLKPESEYSYYFTALSEEPEVIKPESEKSGELKATTLKDYKIEFKSVDEKNNRVWTKIDKYLNGKWDKKEGFVIKGEKIDMDKFVTGCTLKDFQADMKEEIVAGNTMKVAIFKVIYIDKSIEYIKEVKK
ncbi:MAG: fibronectin type III domain-containing protein [Planctomycetes bacterium]|nr:fibronectin type III domain-containing protein [Planctomycetota bacterium]